MDNIINGVVLFTDIRNFTLKTSILTSAQLDDLLELQDNFVLPVVEKNNGKVVKNLGDSYMCVFSLPRNAINCAIEIQELLKIYNKDKKDDLEKIQMRISVNSGEMTVKESVLGVDYFGESVNVAARILNVTPADKIYVSENVYGSVNKNDFNFSELGDYNFKGIPDKVGLHEILLEKEQKQTKNRVRKAVESAKLDKEAVNQFNEHKFNIKEVDKTIFVYSSLCAMACVQPIPFVDYFVVLPIQVFMIFKIAKIHCKKMNNKMARDLFISMITILGFDYINKQILLTLFKIGIPIFGGYVAIPYTFAMTYGLGKLVNCYYYYEAKGKKLTKEEIKDIYKDKSLTGFNIAKDNKDNIVKIGRKIKDGVMENVIFFKVEKMKKFKIDEVLKD